MNLESYSHFSKVPDVAIERSRFSKPYNHKTTFNAGQLVPFYIEDALPASTYELDTSIVCRMATPIFPVMDNAYLDIYYFFVPYRLLWEHWREFNGENTNSFWTQKTDYFVPQINTGSFGFKPKSLADHFGFPVGVKNMTVSQFPFRAYCLIYNEWFRNENTDTPTYFIKSDNDLVITNPNNLNALYGGTLLRVCREHDYFSDCLPQPQKADPVTIPLSGNANVFAYNTVDYNKWAVNSSGNIQPPIYWFHNNPSAAAVTQPVNLILGAGFGTGSQQLNSPMLGSNDPVSITSGSTSELVPANLYADLSGVTAATINDLRLAFATQRYAERLAYGGSRYTEQLNTFYGLTTQDSRLQRPEFLGSDRLIINMTQVLQTSGTSDVSPQGNTAAFSLTSAAHQAPVTYSTQEHGIIMGLMCIRHNRTYQQGINREWSRRELFDFYQPTFAHLGNQPVLGKEIYVDGDGTADRRDSVFGYQEAWGEYRYKPSHVTGEFRSNYPQTLDSWHYADFYDSAPTLSQSWMAEGDTEIKRTLAVQDQDQFIADIYVNTLLTAPMPLYSVPGLLDHF